MGLLHGRDLLSSKWITAIIIDASNRGHFIPIKHTLGNYFVADINKDTYVFNLEGSRIITWAESLAKTFRFVVFFTEHYKPVSGSINEIEMVVQKNDLPRINLMLLSIFKVLGATEKKPFKPHNLVELVKSVSDYEKSSRIVKVVAKNENQYIQQKKNIVNYLDNLNVEQIVTPVKRITEFIEDDLKVTDPKFLGTILSTYQQTDFENKRVTNVPIKAKQGWMKMFLILAVIGMGIAIGWFIYDGGYLDDIGSGFGASFGAISDQELQARYPQCHLLVSAVDSGAVKLDQISKTGVAIYENCPRAVSP